jgi:asparagine synthase (glutamine-hydrolysing)
MINSRYLNKKIFGCGIVGSHDVETSDSVFITMAKSLAHRGPDAIDTWKSEDKRTLLGHTRLAILGTDNRGSQPMTNHDKSITVVYNGEIYNYHELKKNLEKFGYNFKSDTDTEIIVYGYHFWGIEFLQKLNGIFAFALYDKIKDLLFLARDPIGVKPLLYYEIGNSGIIFASESKAILRHNQISANPNFGSILSTWIHHLWQDNDNTWFFGIKSLRPGCFMKIDRKNGNKNITQYWDVEPVSISNNIQIEEYYHKFKDLIIDATLLQTQSDVGFSTTTSGGLDSSTITSIIACNSQYNLDTYTIRYKDSEKIPSINCDPPDFLNGYSRRLVDYWHACKLSNHYKNIKLHFVDVDSNSFTKETIDRAIYALEQMPFDARMLSLYKIYEKIKSHNHKVTLIGQGADELWLGYYFDDDFWRYSPELLSAYHLWKEYYPSQLPFGLSAWNPSFLTLKRIYESSEENLRKHYDFKSDDPLNNLSYFGKNTILQSILMTEDRISMHHSIEARVPWLDKRIVSLAFQIPSYLKINSPNDNKAKYFCRMALHGVVPDHILQRRKSPLPHPPADYKSSFIKKFIIPNLNKFEKSNLMRNIFQLKFITGLPNDNMLTVNDYFKIYSLWRFEKIFLINKLV